MSADLGDYQLHDDLRDLILNHIKNNCDKMTLNDAAPANFSDANTANGTGSGTLLCGVAMTSTDFTVADTTPDGRKVESAVKNGQAITAAGDGSHVCWLDTVNSKVLFCTTLTTTRNGLTTSDSVDFPTIFMRIRDAVLAS